jgi:copper(I)-binding protein
MKSIHHMIAAALLILGAGILGTAAAGDGHGPEAGQATVGDIKITNAWTRASPGNVRTGAGYLVISNTGDAPDTLIGGSTPIARTVEIHDMTMTDGVMRMFQLEDGLTVAPGGTAMLEPGGRHVMLIGLTEKMIEGETVAITLEFKNAGPVEVMFPVKAVGAMGHGHGGHGHE